MTTVELSIIAPALLASLLVLATHVPLGTEVLRRGIIFIDLAIAQVAGLGVIAADMMGWEAQGWRVQVAAVSAALLAALVLHWKSLRRQIRVRGLVSREDGPQADAYFASRSLKSRLGAWASRQSQPLSSRESLMADVAKASLRHGHAPQRPDHWGGYRIRPLEIEFWADGAFRLHDRFRWTRDFPGEMWQISRLYP